MFFTMKVYPVYIILAYLLVFTVRYSTIKESFNQHQNLTSAVSHQCRVLNYDFLTVTTSNTYYTGQKYDNTTNYVQYNVTCNNRYISDICCFEPNKTTLLPINNTYIMWEYNTSNNSVFVSNDNYTKQLNNTTIDIYYLCMWLLTNISKLFR